MLRFIHYETWQICTVACCFDYVSFRCNFRVFHISHSQLSDRKRRNGIEDTSLRPNQVLLRLTWVIWVFFPLYGWQKLFSIQWQHVWVYFFSVSGFNNIFHVHLSSSISIFRVVWIVVNIIPFGHVIRFSLKQTQMVVICSKLMVNGFIFILMYFMCAVYIPQSLSFAKSCSE